MTLARVGFCGMGAAMTADIARAGLPLRVRNRMPGRAALPVSLGATALRAIRDWSGR